MRIVAALAALPVLVPSFAHASHTATARYAASAPGAFCADGCPPVGMNVGGVLFRAALAKGESPTTVAIADMRGEPVAYKVAQDLNGDFTYGGAGEPSVTGCGTTANTASSAVAFKPAYDIAVQVYTAKADCAHLATSGTVTISYAAR